MTNTPILILLTDIFTNIIYITTDMLKLALLLLFALLPLSHSSLLQSHQFWYTALKAAAKTNAPYADYAWNYCDLKCLYFEHYYPGLDFVYINFSEGFFKPNFAACFIRRVTALGAASYELWNTVVLNNTWYNTYCGGDNTDYYALSQGSNPQYTVISIRGIGIGNYPIY